MEKKQLASRRWWGMGGPSSPVFARDGRACLVRGERAGDVMDELVGRVGRALAGGAASGEVLVLCADPTSAARMQARLAASGIEGAAKVRVLTCREYACEVLGDPQSAAATGVTFTLGRARLLTAYETDFVTEDVKTLGTRPKRLREMLKFFYRGWTELSDEDPEWLFTVEEIDTFEFLTLELQYLGAVMEPQVSNLATKALRMDAQVRARFERRRVFVYGYQSLSRASQLLCQLVAGEELVAGAGPQMGVDVFESYAYPAGVEEFVRYNPAAEVVDVDARKGALRRVACGVAGGAGIAGEAPGVTDSGAGAATDGKGALTTSAGAAAWSGSTATSTLDAPDAAAGKPIPGVERDATMWETPADELAGVADAVARAIEAGMDAGDIAIVTFHPWWIQQMAHALKERGIEANAWLGAPKLRGDVRELDRCLALRVVTLLRLLADPRDGMAWRSWFGFGDYLTRSNQFAEMRRQVCGMRIGEGCTVAASKRAAKGGAVGRADAHAPKGAAESAGATAVGGAGDVHRDLAAYGIDLDSDLAPLFAEVRDVRGPKLLMYLVETLAGPDVPLPAALRPLLALGPDARADQMTFALDRLQFLSGVPSRPGVTVAPYTALANVDFDQVYVVGFVNGLFPRADYFDLTKVSVNKQEKMGERDACTAHALAGLGLRGLHVSGFERCERTLADRLGVKQVRIYSADDSGREMVETAPSIYTDMLLEGE